MINEKKVAGYFYWRRDGTCDRMPADSGCPAGKYSARHALDESEMQLKLSAIERLYPPPAQDSESP